MRGSLISLDAVPPPPAPGSDARAAQRLLRECHAALRHEAGPAWAPRTVFDRLAAPFCRAFGFDVIPAGGEAHVCRGLLQRHGAPAAVLLAFGWGQDSGSTWRECVRSGIATSSRWCFSVSGPAVRIYDAHRTHSRRFVEFDVAAVCEQPSTFALAWSLLAGPAALETAVLRSEQHRDVVRESLQAGVHDALRSLTAAFLMAAPRRSCKPEVRTAAFDESLVVVYRVLFLLFAEARGLVPAWHPVFRDSYTIDSLRPSIETFPRPRGVWEALQAIARLAHRGCRAGTLRVPAFNGRLFSPVDAPLADSAPLDDGAVRQALLALTTRRTKTGRERIAYGDLGVEHLGGVYERVLDFDLGINENGAPALIRGGRRRTTGTFYTPRSLTEYVVRRTLAPLVEHATPEAILRVRVLDPAMGSGAFLVAACRYLATAYETALIREGGVTSLDLSDRDRTGFRRTVAQRCLFGVDLNPMSVQLARLSLWLATLSGDRPLTFFDHHLRTGNSLVGASTVDVRRRRAGRSASTTPLPLLDPGELNDTVGRVVSSREMLRTGIEDTVEHVRAKEKLFSDLQRDARMGRWKGTADLWCAAWFDERARGVSRAAFASLMDAACGAGALRESAVEDVIARGSEAARKNRFFHWELEFPEIFYDASGAPLGQPGFDAIIANPPWEMLRGDEGDAETRRAASTAASALTRFARGSGIYRLQGSGHANLYQLFVERALSLVRHDGRVGLVLPAGFGSDHGCAALRRHVLESTTIDSFVVVENREALFPIHRGLKFILLTLSAARSRGNLPERVTVPLRAGIRSASDLDRLPDVGSDPDCVHVPVRLIERLSGDQLAIPELRTRTDLRIAAHIAFNFPASGSPQGWGLEFGRELNATEDRTCFNESKEGLPVVEGKHIGPFTVDLRSVNQYIRSSDAERSLGRRPFDRSRVAYRDVASSTNRLTLIAAVLPAGAVTTHTLFCLRTPLDDEAQHFVTGMLNSFVANYIVRLRVTTHVTVAIMERLPLPKPPHTSEDFATVCTCARALSATPDDLTVQATLQAAAARLYALDAQAFAHILQTFPLVDDRLRTASILAFSRTV